ncbi:hypothetical protein pb186bvf_018428 [Paramecium bursaria]
MGNKHAQNPRLGQPTQCPTCQRNFPSSTLYSAFHSHLDMCLQQQHHQQVLPPPPQPLIQDNYIWLKEDGQWRKKKSEVQGGIIQQYTIEQIKQSPFPEKQIWFKIQLEKKRIPWQAGSDKLNVDMNNLLQTSLHSIKGINMHKEVKIQFIGDKVQDAGGLLREWLTLLFKELCKFNVLQLCETEDVAYKLCEDSEYCSLIGYALGCLFLQNLIGHSLRNYQDCQQFLEDIRQFDQNLYRGWKFLLENDIIAEDLQEYFIICQGNDLIELKTGGSAILVDNTNKAEYVELCIQYYTENAVKNQFSQIQAALYKIIHQQLLSIFTIEEFEMLLYGLPFVDVQEWKEQTIYEAPYPNYQTDQFWKIIGEFDQDQLKKFLHYCTGSYRIPINGFSKLESNRGQYAKFKIIAIPYKDQNSYPIAHTCFNRLELPSYNEKSTQINSLK